MVATAAAAPPDLQLVLVENKLSDAMRFVSEVNAWMLRAGRVVHVDVISIFDDNEVDRDMIEYAKTKYKCKIVTALPDGTAPNANADILAAELADRVTKGALVAMDYKLSGAAGAPKGSVVDGIDLAARIAKHRASAGNPLAGVILVSRFLTLERTHLENLQNAGVQVLLKGNWEELGNMLGEWSRSGLSQGRIRGGNFGDGLADAEKATNEQQTMRRLRLMFKEVGVEVEGPQAFVVGVAAVASIVVAILRYVP